MIALVYTKMKVNKPIFKKVFRLLLNDLALTACPDLWLLPTRTPENGRPIWTPVHVSGECNPRCPIKGPVLPDSGHHCKEGQQSKETSRGPVWLHELQRVCSSWSGQPACLHCWDCRIKEIEQIVGCFKQCCQVVALFIFLVAYFLKNATQNLCLVIQTVVTILYRWLKTFPCRHATDGFIGVLDMFGFEDGKPSQLEQLCINLCSETMQHFYNTHILKTAIESCREEGILLNVDIDYSDNAPCIDLISSLVSFSFHNCQFVTNRFFLQAFECWDNWAFIFFRDG